jgi:hypothetical protein
MIQSVRKVFLTAHVTASVGWLGAVLGFLALAIAGLSSSNALTVRSAYLAMELTAWCVIVPLSLASPLTGVIQSFTTAWGLFRHYWVLIKFLITIPATIVLLLHMQPIARIAGVAAESSLSDSDLRGVRIQLIANAIAALVVLLVATVLSVYKPSGKTWYGLRKDYQQSINGDPAVPFDNRVTTGIPRWVYAFLITFAFLFALFVIKHVIGRGVGGH